MTSRVLVLERPGELIEDRPPAPPTPDRSAFVSLDLELREALAEREHSPDARDPIRLLMEEGVGSLARHVGMSARSLRRHCAQAGIHLADRREQLRVEELERLLSTELAVGAIARRLGFSSSQTLARFLKQRFGQTATQLRCQKRGGRPISRP